MEPTTSESEQDGGVTSGEDNSFENPNASSSGHSETDSQFAEQSPQVPYRTNASTANPDNYAGMMIPSSYLPFMMPQSYQSAIQGTSAMATTAMPYAAANAFFFQNSLAKDAEGLATTGSPLNLQMAGGQTDRPRIGSAPSDFSAATVQQQQQQQHALPPASPSPGIQHARASPHVVSGSSYASPAHQPMPKVPNAYAGVAGNSNQLPGQGRFPGDTVYAETDGAPKLTDYPPPPKKPLTPYMRFNKFMWETVKSRNPSLGVCEISATIGRLWRELGPEDKQRHNNEYTLDKARYDEELKVYLKTTGLRSSDLVKQKPKKSKPSPAQQRRPAAPPANLPPARPSAAVPADVQQPQQHAQLTANHQQQQQQLQALMGLPGSLPIGMPVSFQNMSMLGGFPQMWASAAGQQYAGGLVTPSQLHELYGGVNGVEAPPPAHSQQPSSAAGDAQSSALYRYPQGFM